MAQFKFIVLWFLALAGAPKAFAETKYIAVLELAPSGELSPQYLSLIADELRRGTLSAVNGHPDYRIMTRDRMTVMMTDMGLDPECVKDEGTCEVETGRNVGASYVLSATVAELKGELFLSTKLFDATTGGLLAHESTHTSEPIKLLESAALLSQRMVDAAVIKNSPRGAAGPSKALPEVSIGYGRSHALVIGINKYSSGFSPLKTAVKDAEAIERVLREDFGFSTTLLRDAERAEIYEAVESLSRQLGPKDAVLIYYAGHGELIEETHTAYWIPVDASRGSKGNWLASEDLTRLIREMGAKDVLVISDSCYSGGLAERGAAEELTSLDNEIRIQFLKRQYEGQSRRLIASGSLEPVLDGGGDGHSVFARALLDGLGEMSHESFTASELFNEYLEQAVAGSATQIPENHYLRNSGHKRGDFLFHRRTAATESMSGD